MLVHAAGLRADLRNGLQFGNKRLVNILVFMKNFVSKQKAAFLKILTLEEYSDDSRWVMMKVLNSSDISEYTGININNMAEHYKKATKDTKIEYLKFFAKMSYITKQITDTLLYDLSIEKDELVLSKLNDVITVWLKNAESEMTVI